MATVRPAMLRDTLNSKLGDATLALLEIREAEQPVWNRHTEPGRSVNTFVHAARGVVPVARTFGQATMQPKCFEKWRKDWEARLTQPERDLWLRMITERESLEHGEGVELIDVPIPILRGDQLQISHNHALLGTPPVPGPFKGGVRFKEYPNKVASEVCAEHLGLARRFVDDFLHDHASLIP